MSDSEIRILERRVQEGSATDLDHARLFSRLWKHGDADLYIFVMSMVYERPFVRFEIMTKAKPEGLRVPVVVSMKKLDRREPQSLWGGEAITLSVSGGKAPAKAMDVRWHASWDRVSGSIPCDTEINTVSGETIWATVLNEDPTTSKQWTYYPMVKPAEIP